MRWIFALTIVGSTAAAAAPAPGVAVSLSQSALVPQPTEIDKKTYASVDLPFEEFKPLLKVAEDLAGQKLSTRGEAHMTVLTPPEITRLDVKIRAQVLADLRTALKSEKILPVCIGKGQASVKGKMESTYFVVVEANAIRATREKFGLKDFYPHVTLGFTQRDLHFEDGVRKDKSSCVADVKLEGP